MIDYIKGDITELTPANVVLETNGVGYFIHITLPTFSYLDEQTNAKLFVYEAIREDAYVLYGFRYRGKYRQDDYVILFGSGDSGNDSLRECRGIKCYQRHWYKDRTTDNCRFER